MHPNHFFEKFLKPNFRIFEFSPNPTPFKRLNSNSRKRIDFPLTLLYKLHDTHHPTTVLCTLIAFLCQTIPATLSAHQTWTVPFITPKLFLASARRVINWLSN